MFERYARAGLSYRKDKERAISGLLQQIETTIRAPCVYGTFSCFLSRLLLWRVLAPNNDLPFGQIEETSDGQCSKYELPSWSWLSHDHIKFLPKENIQVSKDTISFGSDQQLNARIFNLEDCHMKENGERHVLLYDDDQEIGEIWFDEDTQARTEDCVVLGRRHKPLAWKWQEDEEEEEEEEEEEDEEDEEEEEEEEDEEEGEEEEYWYILLVSATHVNKYRRDGVGRIKPQYISRTSVEGVLV
jgi:hypothetical protein